MGFGPFVLISLFYAVIGVRVVIQVVERRRETFDRRFTNADRSLVDMAAFFILVPISVALHELGHAIAIWLFGSEVVDFGYYVFAGFVSYPGNLADWKEILIALAGSLVNVLLSGIAMAIVFLKQPPLRAAYNELLLQFALLSGANALIFYPLIDVIGGMDGDWSQIYFGGVPALSVAILVCHVAILGLVWWGWKNTRVMRQVNRLTGVPPGAERGILGGLRPARPALLGAPGSAGGPSAEAVLLAEAGERVASGWGVPVKRSVRDGADGTLLTLVWQTATEVRGVVARAGGGGPIEIFGTIPVTAAPGTTQVPLHARQRLARFDGLPSADDLTIALRLAMEEVARWQPVAA
jgi:Zn-dependent protease